MPKLHLEEYPANSGDDDNDLLLGLTRIKFNLNYYRIHDFLSLYIFSTDTCITSKVFSNYLGNIN